MVAVACFKVGICCLLKFTVVCVCVCVCVCACIRVCMCACMRVCDMLGVIVVLLCVWKCSRETVRQYLCCCLGKPSKNVVHSMQQENQRLRHELSQHKVSMSGRFQPGQLSE